MSDREEQLFSGIAPELPSGAEPAPAPEEIVQQPEVVTEPIAPEPAPETVEPVRDENGRTVPLPTFLDMRDQLKDERRRREEAEARVQQQAPQQAPDPLDDPNGFAAYNQNQFQQAILQERFTMSELMAKQAHGAETVDTATGWALEKAKSNPLFAEEYKRQPHPIDWIVQQHKRDALLSDIGDNVDDWFTREAAKRGYAIQSAPNPAAPQNVAITQPALKPPAPPRSIANDAAASANVQGDPRAEFLAIFDKR